MRSVSQSDWKILTMLFDDDDVLFASLVARLSM